jgi:hypothetical protein
VVPSFLVQLRGRCVPPRVEFRVLVVSERQAKNWPTNTVRIVVVVVARLASSAFKTCSVAPSPGLARDGDNRNKQTLGLYECSNHRDKMSA